MKNFPNPAPALMVSGALSVVVAAFMDHPAMGSMVLTAPADGEEYGGYVVPEYLDTEDAEFIAHARTDVPALVAALRAVLELHVKARPITVAYDTQERRGYCYVCAENWPCRTVTAIHQHLGEDA